MEKNTRLKLKMKIEPDLADRVVLPLSVYHGLNEETRKSVSRFVLVKLEHLAPMKLSVKSEKLCENTII